MTESHPCTDPNWIQLWRDHTREDMIHDANVGTLKVDSMALWRLYGGTKENVHQDGERKTRERIATTTKPKPEIHFYFRKQTDMYTDDGAFNPFGGTAESTVPVGVYHDAGPDIDGKLAGCRTLRMSGFGTPSDPASKPRPFAYQPYAGDISIPGCAFGFDPTVVGEVIIQEFKGTSARYGFSYIQPNGQAVWCDGATGVSTPDKPDRFSIKYVNDRSGYFGGNAANAEAAKNQGSVPYYIGKVLGDALQVFAMLPQLPTKDGWITNPAYAARVSLSSEPKVISFPVDQLILNTGDELEYARAVAWKQTALYISPPNKEKIHKAVCTPGVSLDLDPVAEYSRFVKRVNEVLLRFGKRFEIAIKSMEDSISDEMEIFNSAYSKLGGLQFITTEDQKKEARTFIQACIESTTRVRGYIESKVKELIGTIQLVDRPDATDNEVIQIRTLYTKLNDVLPHWTPSGPIADIQGKNRYMVGNVRQKFPVAETEEFTFAIRFKEVFEAIKGGRDYSKFIPNWLAPQPVGGNRRRTLRKYKGKRGGADPYGDSSGARIYNAFTGMINAGLSVQYQRSPDVGDPDTVITPRQDSLYYEFLAESEADASLSVRTAEFAKFTGPPVSIKFGPAVQNSGYTTFTDFIEFACGYESNTLPPQAITLQHISYAILLINQCQTSEALRDQALLGEITDIVNQLKNESTKPVEPSSTSTLTTKPLNIKKDMMTLVKQRIPDRPGTTRRRSFGLPSASTQMVQSSTRPLYGGRTFRRRLPKLI